MSKVIIHAPYGTPYCTDQCSALDPRRHIVGGSIDADTLSRMFANLLDKLVEDERLTLEEAGLIIESWPMEYAQEDEA